MLRYFRSLSPDAWRRPIWRCYPLPRRGVLRGLSGERKAEMLNMALPPISGACFARPDCRPVLGFVTLASLTAILPLSADPLLRDGAAPSVDAAQMMATTLRLSKKQTMRLIKAMEMPLDLAALSKMLYFDGAEAVADRALLALASLDEGHEMRVALEEAADEAAAYQRPKFPLTGKMMQQTGMADGPAIGQMAFALEQWWVAEGFPNIEAVERGEKRVEGLPTHSAKRPKAAWSLKCSRHCRRFSARTWAAIIKKIELDIAAAPLHLFVAHRLIIRHADAPSGDFGINIDKGAPYILREGEICIPITAVEMVEKNAACAARFIAVRQKEVIIAFFFESRIVSRIMLVADRLIGGMKIDSVFVVGGAGGVQHRR